nr:histone PARylation factor 1 isoform X2 [Nomia melanderi]
MSDIEEQFKAYQKDSRISCRYGAKCYQKNPAHHEKYKHPPSKNKKQRGPMRTVINKKRKQKDNAESSTDSPKKKVQKTDDNVTDENASQISNIKNKEESKDHDEAMSNKSNSDNEKSVKDPIVKVTIASLLKDCNVTIENDEILPADVQTIISHLFLIEMPTDFFQLYEFCKNISEKDPLNAFKDVQLQLVGPYDVYRQTFLNSKVDNRKSLLRHWRYYYDPPEFQTIIKANTKEGLHFGYWRDDPSEKPVFVAKNKASIDCVIEPVAENIFGTLHIYIGEKLKAANPFEKIRIAQLHQKLKDYAKEKDITLDKNTSNMRAREKKVVTRTFHKAGIVVPYDKKTELGYRDLAVTDNELRKLLKQIEEAGTPEEKRKPLSKLEEVIRLATIAADECDFGTCLELGHDLFCSGVSSVQNKALHMLSLAYNLLQRPQFLKIAQAHLELRRKDQDLNVLY